MWEISYKNPKCSTRITYCMSDFSQKAAKSAVVKLELSGNTHVVLKQVPNSWCSSFDGLMRQDFNRGSR